MMSQISDRRFFGFLLSGALLLFFLWVRCALCSESGELGDANGGQEICKNDAGENRSTYNQGLPILWFPVLLPIGSLGVGFRCQRQHFSLGYLLCIPILFRSRARRLHSAVNLL
jgi:hypothetical protein